MADFDACFSNLDQQSGTEINKVSSVCSNCCSPFHLPSSNCEGDDSQRVCEMLSAIYKLSCSSSSNSFILCPLCTEILHELFSLFCKFNQLRQLESQLHREIQNVDNILINSQQQPNHNKNSNKNNTNPKRHSSFSVADGPWVKIGARLEEMEFKQIGYKPQTHSSSAFQPPPPPKQQQEKVAEPQPLSVNQKEEELNFNDNNQVDEDFNNSNENDGFYDDFVPEEIESEDVKLFSQPVHFDSDDSAPLSETPVKRKRGRPKTNSEGSEISASTPKSKGRPKKREKRRKLQKPSKRSRMEQRIAEKELAQLENPPPENPTINSSETTNPNPEPTKRKRRRKKKGDPPAVVGIGRPPSKYQKFTPAELEEYQKCLGDYTPPIIDRLAAEQEESAKFKCVASGCSTTEEFKTVKALEKHEKTVHKKDKGPFVCNLNKTKGGKVVCKFEAKSLQQLRSHQNTGIHALLKDNNRVTCLKCGVSLQSQTSYRTHFFKIHTESGKIWYQETASKANERARVKRAEENAKGFVCKICNIDFMSRMRLTSHRMSEHQDYGTRYKRYVCEICGKTCMGKYRLNFHVSFVHSDERPFVCHLCGKSFKEQRILDSHMKRTHDDEGRLQWNLYIQENVRRRKIIAEALKRKEQEQQNLQGNEQVGGEAQSMGNQQPESEFNISYSQAFPQLDPHEMANNIQNDQTT